MMPKATKWFKIAVGTFEIFKGVSLLNSNGMSKFGLNIHGILLSNIDFPIDFLLAKSEGNHSDWVNLEGTQSMCVEYEFKAICIL